MHLENNKDEECRLGDTEEGIMNAEQWKKHYKKHEGYAPILSCPVCINYEYSRIHNEKKIQKIDTKVVVDNDGQGTVMTYDDPVRIKLNEIIDRLNES